MRHSTKQKDSELHILGFSVFSKKARGEGETMSIYFEAKEVIDKLQRMLLLAQESGDIPPVEQKLLSQQVHNLFVKLVVGRIEGDEWMSKAIVWVAVELHKLVGKESTMRNLLLMDAVKALAAIVPKEKTA